MQDTHLLEDQPIAWTPTPDVIERAQLTRFMKQVGVSTWDELYEFSIRDVEKFTEEVLKFLDIRFGPPYEKLLDTSNGIEMPTWLAGAGLNITEMCLDRWVRIEREILPAYDRLGDEGKWEEAEAQDGYSLVYYDVLFDKAEGNFSSPVHIQASDNKSLSTGATITPTVLNSIAEKAGAAAGQEVTLKWTVRSNRGVKTALATQSRTITIIRKP